MKICFVSKEAAREGRTSIGCYVLEAGKALRGSGHEVWLVTKDPGEGAERITREIPGFDRILFAGEGIGPGEDPEFLQGKPHYPYSDLVHRTLSSAGVSFDYIEFPNFEAEGVVPILEQQMMGSYEGTVLGVGLHTPTYESLKFNGQLHRLTYDLRHTSNLEDLAVRYAALRVCPSASLLGILSDRLDLPPGFGHVLRYPMEFPAEFPDPPAPRRSLEDLSFVYFGRIEPRKGVLQLVRAFADLPRLQLKVVGGDTLYDPFGRSFRDYVRRVAPPNVTFLDHLPHERVLELVEKSDVCILPSLWDNYPHTCIESMGLARVVIGGRNGGISEIIQHGKDGFLVDGSDPAQIVRCIKEDLAGNLDRLDEIGRKAAQGIREISDPAVFSSRLTDLVKTVKYAGKGVSIARAGEKKVTVVIPFFKGKDTIGEAVDSALAQTHPDIEVLVIDDGSPLPESGEILENLAGKDSRVRIIRKENGGLGSARNRGILEASGEYIIFLDDDDVILPRYAELGAASMERRPEIGYLVPYTKFSEMFGERRISCFNPMPFDWSTALVINQFGTAGAFFRREVFLEKGIRYDEDLIAYEDWALWMDLAAKGVKGDILPRVCYEYRIRKSSMMTLHGWPYHVALLGWLIHKHLPGTGERGRDILTILSGMWGGVATAARFQKVGVEAGAWGLEAERDFSPVSIRPTPVAPAPLRHKVVDALAELAGKAPFLSRTARRLLVGIAWFLKKCSRKAR